MFEYANFFKENIIDYNNIVAPSMLNITNMTSEDAKKELSKIIALIRSGEKELAFENIQPFINDRFDYDSFIKLINQADFDINNLYNSIKNLIDRTNNFNSIITGVFINPIKSELVKMENDISTLEALNNVYSQSSQIVEVLLPNTNSFVPTENMQNIINTTPRIDYRITNKNFCINDIRKKAITLPIEKINSYSISYIEIISAETTQSLITPITDIEAINSDSTFEYNIYTNMEFNDEVVFSLRIELKNIVDVSSFSIDIDNNSEINSIELIAKDYSTGTAQDILLYSGTPNRISKENIIEFNRIRTNSFKIKLTNRQGKIVNETLNGLYDNNIIENLANAINVNVGPDVSSVISTNEIKKYSFMVNNIKINSITYLKDGIAITNKVSTSPIRSYKFLAEAEYTDGESIEYNIVREAYSDKGKLMLRSQVPVLPIDLEYIDNELLLLDYNMINGNPVQTINNSSNSAILRFNAHKGYKNIIDYLKNIKVYANGRLLTPPNLFLSNGLPSQIIDDADYYYPDINITLSSGDKMISLRNFTIITIVNPKYGVRYTVSYRPTFLDMATSKDRMMSISSSGRYGNDGTLYFENNILDNKIYNTKIYEIIIMRNNNFSKNANIELKKITRILSTYE